MASIDAVDIGFDFDMTDGGTDGVRFNIALLFLYVN